MAFKSILFKNGKNLLNIHKVEEKAPDHFPDLNLDQIIDAITRHKEVYNLKPFFYTKLAHVSDIKYRQEVMMDLENIEIYAVMDVFAEQIREMHAIMLLSNKSSHKVEKERLFLDAVSIYINAIIVLKNQLSNADLKSVGFLELQEFLTDYTISSAFLFLSDETKNLNAGLDSVRYSLHIKDLRIEVRPNFDERNYSKEVEDTFKIFQKESVKDYRVEFTTHQGINHVQASILEGVAQLYPEIFQKLKDYPEQHAHFLDKTIERLDREIQFYMAYLDYIEVIKTAGLSFCYPEITKNKNELYNYQGFDLALAIKLIAEKSPVVCNDFQLSGPERVIVITGPNQGGKTTYARTIGQLHYFANIGCSVAGAKARLLLFDNIFTHFEKEERTEDHLSKLESDLLKVHQILLESTEKSIFIMNEIFSSTTLQDAVFLSKKVMNKIFELDAICVWVTFINELASLNEKTISMVSSVVPEKPEIRTFKIKRKETTELIHAVTIAEKHKVTYDQIKERIKR